jgi:hypothetical protein
MLIQATLKWHVPEQPLNPCVNVFHYKSFLTVTDELNAFITAFDAVILPAVQALVNDSTIFDQVVAIDLADPAAEASHAYPSGTIGDITGDYLPLWCTASFEYRRKVRGDRSGRKGFGAVSETSSTFGKPTVGYRTIAETQAAVLGAALRVGLIDTWFPVIGVRPVPPATAWSSHDIQAVIFKDFGSQNTRKR